MNHLVNLKCLLKVSSKWRTDPSTNKVWFPQATWLRVAWTRYRNNIDLAQHCYKHTHTHSWTVCRWKRVQDAALWLDGAGGRGGASRHAGGGAQHAANQYTGMLKYSCRGWRRNTQTHTDNGAGKHNCEMQTDRRVQDDKRRAKQHRCFNKPSTGHINSTHSSRNVLSALHAQPHSDYW